MTRKTLGAAEVREFLLGQPQPGQLRAPAAPLNSNSVREFLLGTTAPAPTDNPPGTQLSRGLAQFGQIARLAYGSALEGTGKVTGAEELEKYGARQVQGAALRLAEQQQHLTRLKDIEDVASAGRFAGETFATQAPFIGTTVGGSAAGAALGSVLGPPGAVAGGIIGGLAVNLPFFYGLHREEQKEADQIAGRPVEVDEGVAFLTAIPSAGLDLIADKFLVKGLVPKPGNRLLTRVVKGTGAGVAAEVPTEVGQEIIQRAQAGKPLFDDEALEIYTEVAVAAGLVGGGFKGTASGFGVGVDREQEGTPPILDDVELGTEPAPTPEQLPTQSPDILPETRPERASVGGTPQTALEETVIPEQPDTVVTQAVTEALRPEAPAQVTSDDETIIGEIQSFNTNMFGGAASETVFDQSFVKVGPKLGTVPGGIYFSQDSPNTFVVKEYANKEQAAQEHLAATLFSRLLVPEGVVSPNKTSIIKTGSGKFYLASEVEAYQTKQLGKTEDQAPFTGLQDTFIAHAWLGNWDAVGQELDNVLLIEDKASGFSSYKFVDFGGALEYRAQGKKKLFTGSVSETQTMLDPEKNPQAAKVFKGITPDRIKQQVQNLRETFLSETGVNQLAYIISKVPGLTNADRSRLFKRLYRRGVDLVNRYLGESMPVSPIVEFETKHDNTFPTFLPLKTSNKDTKFDQAKLDKVEAEAFSFQTLSQNIFGLVDTDQKHISAMLNSPEVMGLLDNESFNTWLTEGSPNKLWWDIEKVSLVIYDAKGLSAQQLYTEKGLLPPILFHGTSSAKTHPVYNRETGHWEVLPYWKTEMQGSATGGDDTKLGAFLTDAPGMAQGWAKLPYGFAAPTALELKTLGKSYVQAFVVKVDPYLANVDAQWNPKTTLDLANQAKNRGFNSLLMIGVEDSPGTHNQLVIFNPGGENMKSPFSKAFDPKSRHFSASTVVGGKERTWRSLTLPEATSLKEELKVFGLDGLVDMKVFTQAQKPGRAAYFEVTERGIAMGISSHLPSNMTFKGQIHHEAIHALRYFGFFNTAEGKKMWRVLQNAVRQRGGISDGVKNNYPVEFWLEEEIAILAAEYEKGTFKAEGFLATTLQRMKNFWTALSNWGKGLGFRTAEDVYTYLTSGKLSDRQWIAEAQDVIQTGFDIDVRSTFNIASRLNVPVSPTLKKSVDYYGRLTKFGWTVIQLAKKNLHIPWLQNYVQRAGQWHNKKTQWLAQADRTLDQWTSLTSSQQQALSQTLLEVEQMLYRSPEEVEKGVIRKPTKEELVSIFKKNKLGADAVKTYIQVRKDFDAMLNEIERVTLASIASSLSHDSLAFDIETAKAKKEFKNLRKAPYFPHARFGEYTIIVKDSDGNTVYAEMFETENARDKAVLSVQSKFRKDKGFTVAKSKLSEEAKVYSGIPQSLLIQMKTTMDLSLEQMKILDEMIVHSMPAISFKNHFVHKENIPGYSQDALRAYADYFWHGANHVARIEFAPMMEQELLNGESNMKEMIAKGEDSTNRRKILDHLLVHFESIMNPKEDWAGLRAVGFMWHLGYNVKSAVLNFTQVPMVTYSYLGANFGDVKGVAAMTKAMTQLKRMYRSPQKAVDAHTDADGKLIALGIQQGFLDESFAAHIAGIAEGSYLQKSRAKSIARKALLNFNHVGGYMFQSVEKLNRRISFMAAVDLARANPEQPYLNIVRKRYSIEYQEMLQKGFSPKEATAFLAGKDTVESTQFNYSAWARPRVMQGRKSAFFTFFMFTQNMLWFIGNSPGNSRYILMLLLFGGLQALPGMEDLEAVVKATGARAFGKQWDMEKELREILVDYLGDDVPPDLFLRGLSRYGFGLAHLGDVTGLPLPSIDMSGNIGMGSPLPIISPAIQAAAGGAQGRDFDEVLGEFTQEGAGPSLGIPIAIVKAMADSRMQFSDPKRWEGAMPAALGAASKGYRMLTEGAETTRTGAEIIQFEPNNPVHTAEAIAQMLGFRPTRVAQTWDRYIMQREAENFWRIRREILLRKYDWAKEGKDRELVQEARAAVRRFNNDVPYRALKISRSTLARSRKARELSRAKTEKGLPNAKMMKGVYKDIQRLHPELEMNIYQEELPK